METVLRIYDIHTHIAPGLDDGVKDEFEMIKILQMLDRDNVYGIFLTPHYNHRFQNDVDLAQYREKIANSVQKNQIRCNLFWGNENEFSSNLFEMLGQDNAHTLAGSKYLLLEFACKIHFEALIDGLNSVMRKGYYPILAHCERYDALFEHEKRIEQLKEMGVYIQVNAGNFLLKNKFSRRYRFANKLLKNDLIDFIASDCHGLNISNTTINIKAGYDFVLKKYGVQKATHIFCDNPEKIIENRRIV